MDQTSHFSLHVAVSGSDFPPNVKLPVPATFWLAHSSSALMFSLLFSMTRFFERSTYDAISDSNRDFCGFPSMP